MKLLHRTPISADVTGRLAAHPDHVFACVVDPTRWERWLPICGGWPDGPPDTLDQGARFRQRLGQHGIYDICEMTVVENVAPSTLILHGEGSYGADAQLSIQVAPGPDGDTEVRIEIVALGGLAQPVATLARLGLQRQLDSAIERLARVL